MLAAQAPDLHEALQQAKDDGTNHVIIDSKLFAGGRLGEQTTSVKGQQIDAWYSGKAHAHGGNVQALSAPDGFPLCFDFLDALDKVVQVTERVHGRAPCGVSGKPSHAAYRPVIGRTGQH